MTRQTRKTFKKPGFRKILLPLTLGLVFVGFVAFTLVG
jgi:hypothetical protein